MMGVKVRWRGRCNRHKRYDPYKQGPGAAVASCPVCQQMVRVARAEAALRLALELLDNLLEGEEGVENARRQRADAPVRAEAKG